MSSLKDPRGPAGGGERGKLEHQLSGKHMAMSRALAPSAEEMASTAVIGSSASRYAAVKSKRSGYFIDASSPSSPDPPPTPPAHTSHHTRQHANPHDSSAASRGGHAQSSQGQRAEGTDALHQIETGRAPQHQQHSRSPLREKAPRRNSPMVHRMRLSYPIPLFSCMHLHSLLCVLPVPLL